MSPRPSTEGYTAVAILLHWAMALAIVALFLIGWFMVDLPKGPERGATFALHKSIGLTVFALLLLRVAWRVFNPPPPPPPGLAPWQRTLSGAAHLALYALMVLQPLTGYISSSFAGYGTSWFGLVRLPDWGGKNPDLNELFSTVHESCSVALALVVAVHVAGALRHLITPGDHTFRRMLRPGRRAGG